MCAVRCELCIPGGVVVGVVDDMGNVTEPTLATWQRLQVRFSIDQYSSMVGWGVEAVRWSRKPPGWRGDRGWRR